MQHYRVFPSKSHTCTRTGTVGGYFLYPSDDSIWEANGTAKTQESMGYWGSAWPFRSVRVLLVPAKFDDGTIQRRGDSFLYEVVPQPDATVVEGAPRKCR